MIGYRLHVALVGVMQVPEGIKYVKLKQAEALENVVAC